MTEDQAEAYAKLLEIIMRDHIRNNTPLEENCKDPLVKMESLLREGMKEGGSLLSNLMKRGE